MRLIQLRLEEFGGLKNMTLTPHRGLTVIEGDNETGKSTLLLFIKFMLYGLPKRGSAERERSVSRDGHRAAGSMTVSVDGEEYRIERAYSDGGRGSEKKTVYRLRDNEIVFSGEEPGEALLGVPREIFESSALIGQLQCAALGGKKEVAAIRNLLTTADEAVDLSKIEKRLEEIRVLYRHKKGEGGLLVELERRINEERRRLDGALESKSRLEELTEKLAQVQGQTKETASKLTAAEELLRQCNGAQILSRFDDLRRAEEQTESLSADKRRLSERYSFCHEPTAADGARLSMLADSLERAWVRKDEAERTAERLTEAMAELETEAALGESVERAGGAEALLASLRKEQKKKRLGLVGVILGGVVAALGAAALAVHPVLWGLPLLWAGIGCLGIGAVSAAGFGALMRSGAVGEKKRASAYGVPATSLPEKVRSWGEALTGRRALEQQRVAARAEQEAAEEHGCHLQAELTAALKKTATVQEETPAAARVEAARIEAYLGEAQRLREMAESLRQTVQRERELLSAYREEELRETVTVDPRTISPEMIGKAKKEQSFYAEQARVLSSKEDTLRTELINCRARAEDPLVIRDRLEELTERKAKAEEYYEALQMAMEALTEAGETMRGNVTPAINRNAGKLMDFISDGRYGELRVDNAMTVSVVEANGMTADAEVLSGGTRDAAYIALRLGLMMQIFGGELPPLMMDETLCQLDDTRAKRVLALLGRLCGQELQCLLFTCHRREGDLCKKLEIEHELVKLQP